MNKIEVKNLSYIIDNHTILDNINFEIEFGSITSIMGKNGSGKSTIIKFLSYILKSDKVFIKGKNLKDYNMKERAKLISYVPQTINNELDFTVLEYVLMARTPYTSIFSDYTENDRKIALKYMEDMGVLHLKNRKISSLSGGEMQKTNLARALTQESEIILLDEAISAIDITSSKEILDYLKKINKKYNKTIIFIIHDLNKALMYSDYTILLKDGRVEYYGKSKEIISPSSIKKVFDIDVSVVNYKKDNFYFY